MRTFRTPSPITEPHSCSRRAVLKRALARVAPLGLLLIAGACAPVDGVEPESSDLGEDDGVLAEKALPSATYQAESRTAQNGCSVSANHAGYTGSGFADFGENGTWVEWNNVSAPQAGRYDLRLRYANGGSQNRAAAILVNGQSVGGIAFSATGAWTSWGTTSLGVSLVRGNNTIRVLASTDAGGPNLDRVDVVGTDLCPNDSAKVEPGDCGCGIPEGSCSGGNTLLDRPSGTKLRIGSWNVFRGSVFPKTDSVWRVINNSGSYQVARTEGGTRVFKAIDADIWLLQETVYGGTDGVAIADINNRIAQHMRSLTGDSWSVRCNGGGLCTIIRGGLRFAESFNPHHRVAGNRVVLSDGSKVLLVNVHYMDRDHAVTTANLISSAGSGDDAVFVAGDFNDGINGPRYSVVDAVSGMTPLTMAHARDAQATHLSSNVKNAPSFKATHGGVGFGEGSAGQDVVTSVGGGTIDHFFLRSDSWQGSHRYILNSLLLSRATLAGARMTPLDIALKPEDYKTHFRDFMSRGIVYEPPSGSRSIAHDHLPMIIDFTWR